MVEWDRNLDTLIQLSLVVAFTFVLIIKRKNLGDEIFYFIVAMVIIAVNNALALTSRFFFPRFNTIPFYVFGVTLGAFLFFFLYLRKLLVSAQARMISLVLTISFIVLFICFAIFRENFFQKFPFRFYFIELFILVINIFLVLRETFNSDKVLNIKSYYPIWICTGLMIVYLAVAPLLIISNLRHEVAINNIFFIILFIVNMLGYSLMLVGVFFAKSCSRNREFF